MAIKRMRVDTGDVVESEAYERGRLAWPTFAVSRERFDAHVNRLGATGEHAVDLYLALGCALGEPAAIAAFERAYVTQVPQFIAGIDASPAVADETQQLLRDYALVGAHPRIADYAGRGPLGGWVRVIACRFVLQMKRRDGRVVDSDADVAARLTAADPSPEVALVRARHGTALAAALIAAISALPAKERALIKLSLVDGLTIDELCGLYHVHRATVARWIARLKDQIFETAVARLRKELQLDTDGIESLYQAVRSQLDFSLGGVLDT